MRISSIFVFDTSNYFEPAHYGSRPLPLIPVLIVQFIACAGGMSHVIIVDGINLAFGSGLLSQVANNQQLLKPMSQDGTYIPVSILCGPKFFP